MWRNVHVSLKPGSTCVESTPETGTFETACPYTPFTSPAGWAIICLFVITVMSSLAGIAWLFIHRYSCLMAGGFGNIDNLKSHIWLLLMLVLWKIERAGGRSEEHTSELQSIMRISYSVFCLKK